MRRRNWYILIGLLLIVSSAVFYAIHYFIFHDPHHIFIYMIGDVAFVFLEVLLVTLIIHQLLTERDKRIALEKLNMVIGTFFSQVGTELLREFCVRDSECEEKRNTLILSSDLEEEGIKKMQASAAGLDYKVDSMSGDLDKMKKFLVGNRDFMLRLLENPLLLEHESFTDLLWAVFHLTEELANRPTLSGLPEADYGHLAGDMGRAYGRLVREWIGYMDHLRQNYPYLFSLALRTNPFDPRASVVFQ